MLPEWFHQLGLMGMPLVFCSVASFALCCERIVFFVGRGRNKETLYKTLSDYLTAHKAQPKALRDEMMMLMLRELQHSYERSIKGLSFIGMMSPMLGLLGTILGIIAAFKVIAAQTGPVLPSMIADGLWEAMLTTAAGLLIALPSLFMAHVFRALGRGQMEELSLRLNKLSMSLELEKNAKGAR